MDDAQADLEAQHRTLVNCKLLNTVHLFKSGADLLTYLKTARSESPSSHFIIFLDLVMKPDDGIAVLQKMQQEKLTERSVIVMLSGLTDVKMLHAGYQLGAHTFLVKPLKVEDVMELVSSLKHFINVVSDSDGNRLVWQKHGTTFKPTVV